MRNLCWESSTTRCLLLARVRRTRKKANTFRRCETTSSPTESMRKFPSRTISPFPRLLFHEMLQKQVWTHPWTCNPPLRRKRTKKTHSLVRIKHFFVLLELLNIVSSSSHDRRIRRDHWSSRQGSSNKIHTIAPTAAAKEQGENGHLGELQGPRRLRRCSQKHKILLYLEKLDVEWRVSEPLNSQWNDHYSSM